MAGLAVGGLGSGLDVTGMTQQLVAAERMPKEQRIQSEMSKVEVSLSAYGQVKASASAVHDLVEKYEKDEAFSSKEASSSDPGYVGVSVESHAQNGSYSVEVKRLAQSHKVASADSFDADPDISLGSGNIVIGIGDDSFTLTVDPDKSSLKDVVEAINSSTENPGVTATIITDDDGAKIVFSSTKTGESHKINIDASAATGELTKLSYDPDDPASTPDMLEMQEAQDAQIIIDGFSTITSDTNKFEDAIDGVTFDVSKITGTLGTGDDTDEIDVKNVRIEISNDTAKSKNAVSEFTDTYNELVDLVTSQSKYDIETETAGPLVGDSLSRSLLSQLRNAMNEGVTVNGQEYFLSDFGVGMDRYGNLEVDSEVLDDMLDEDFQAFAAFFNGDDDNGFLYKVDELLEGFVGNDGSITSKEDSLKEQRTRLNDDLATLDERMKAFEDRTYKQLTAMDSAIYKMTNELNTMMSLLY
ncbi:flagellar hook protein [Photobacterium gaetbulicola]|uniref:Flagellar hook-associated protein 2 n=1 Tax=Photobacterium gaetbulicola TaxID=1295392 RepID=A0A0B9FY90_9GAMM|nr:flagellar filament capping protein FliD [Photobacterium gaetbulicola]KHT61518.1 flagellar hook protein [Photobacterium gaetbulicola]